MNKTASGGSITLTVLHAYRDEPLTLTGLKYSVYDADGVVLFGPADAPGFDPAQGQTDILIPGTLNETTEKFDVRTVRFKLITANGVFNTAEFYEIEGDVLKLTPYIDSFVTYPESLLVRRKISQQMPFYDALDDEDRAIALSNSFTRLSALKFGNLGTVQSLTDLDPAQIAALDPKFLEALKMAQLVEANHMVEVNPVRDKIKMGIISETIGESSMFFKQTGGETRTAYAGISDDAYPLLSKYLYRATSNPQIWKLRRS